jgi:arginyl-tRNA synthetase
VVDYGGANLAKEMHIGHLRSSIIGDAIVRVLGFAGHDVVRQNHIGDWGTQFGMLLEHLIDSGWNPEEDHSLSDLNALYQAAKLRFDQDAGFAQRSRDRVVRLQSGDEQSLSFWRKLIDESCSHMNEVFQRLGVLLRNEDLRGESFYNSRLAKLVEDLRARGVLEESDGAQVVFCQGFKTKSGDPLPLIVQKSDGGYGYATTDLAAVRFRVEDLAADRVIYVVDARQSDHFAMVFAASRAAGWVGEHVRLEHVAFGTILGNDKRPFRTRSGDNVKLAGVIDEAVARALATLKEKGRDLDDAELHEIARAVGVGAVKYADLSSDRIKDYVFDYSRMLSMEGNTAPYLQYAYVRLQSIARRAGTRAGAADLRITDPAERRLLLELLRLPRIVDQVAQSLEPHRLCTYLYELSSLVHHFHEHCPVLKAPDPETTRSRLALTELSARTLRLGLELLGVTVVDRM